ncbi:hypothetical protein ACFWXO_09445 [Kitasatospora sp. NPDC059088]
MPPAPGPNPTVVLAVLRGLLLDLLAGGGEADAARVQAAWRDFLDATLD